MPAGKAADNGSVLTVTSHPGRLVALLAALAAALLLALAPAAGAKGRGDRNHDRIPDRWERAHRLSLKQDQAKRDQDHDGLRNLAEFLAGTDPRDADSDGDGTDDGDEGAGRIVAFEDGELTIRLFHGAKVTGAVTDDTEIACEEPGEARAANDPEDAAGEEEPGDGEGIDEGDPGEELGEDELDDEDTCGVAELTPGRVVREAEMTTAAAGLVFDAVALGS
jgi:hypothetical protein